jgi:hypothetical protein
MRPGNEKSRTHGTAAVAEAIGSVVDVIFSLAKLGLIASILFIIWENRVFVGDYLSKWLNQATHVELWGVAIDRQLSAEKSIDEIAARNNKNVDLPQINTACALGAIVRASRNAPAMAGARILWVDGNPQNNAPEEGILNDIGIDVRRALTTKQAVDLLPGLNPDLIISNVWRDNDEAMPLSNCPARFFDSPYKTTASDAQTKKAELETLNAKVMAGTTKATGFTLAEAIHLAHLATIIRIISSRGSSSIPLRLGECLSASALA